jgi:hypothetical protein
MNLHTTAESELLQVLSSWIEKGRPFVQGMGSAGDSPLSCPSASDKHGEKVFATFDEHTGELSYLSEPIVMPDIAKENLDLDRFVEKNRLAGQCYTKTCQHWQGACRLGYFVSNINVSVSRKSRQCAIEDNCRWLKENGPKVCGPCGSIRNLPFGV